MEESSRSLFLSLLLIFPGIGIGMVAVFGAELKRFAAEVPTLSSTADIERLKQVVARQMYAALAQIVILGMPMIVFFIGITKRQLGPGDLVFIIVPSAAVLLIAQAYKKVEKRVQTIPAADDELTRQRDEIVHTWLKKPVPDW